MTSFLPHSFLSLGIQSRVEPYSVLKHSSFQSVLIISHIPSWVLKEKCFIISIVKKIRPSLRLSLAEDIRLIGNQPNRLKYLN